MQIRRVQRRLSLERSPSPGSGPLLRLTLVVGDSGQEQLGLGVHSRDQLLDLVSGLILGPAVDGAHGFGLVGVPHVWNRSPKLCLNQLAEGRRHLVVVGREESQGLLQTGERVPLLDAGPQLLEQV